MTSESTPSRSAFVSARTLGVVAVALALCAAMTVWHSVRRAGRRPGGTPRGIVALSPALTDLLFQMGAGEQVVGIASYSHLPAGQTRPVVGDYLRVDREQILRLNPAVIVTQNDHELLRQLENDHHIRVERIAIETVDDVRAALVRLDGIAGGDGGAKRVRRMDADLAAVRAAVADCPRRRVLLTMGRDPIQPIGRGTFLDDLLAIAGGTNVMSVRGYPPRFNDEQIAALRPEVIVDIADALVGSPEAALRARQEAWNSLGDVPAVREGRVYVLNDATITIPDARLGATAGKLARAIHSEAFAIGATRPNEAGGRP